jgi:hypothetical protein
MQNVFSRLCITLEGKRQPLAAISLKSNLELLSATMVKVGVLDNAHVLVLMKMANVRQVRNGISSTRIRPLQGRNHTAVNNVRNVRKNHLEQLIIRSDRLRL